MSGIDVDVSPLPQPYREPFASLGRLLADLAGENWLGLWAFGGWLANDPFSRQAAATSVVILRQFDLRMLDRLAAAGVKLARQGLAPPLVMTPEHIQGSCDTFPLELLEIQQLGVPLAGENRFAGLKFAPADVRLQCERELKSKLIHLRQGLLMAAGKRKLLQGLCRSSAERAIRVLRGLLHLAGEKSPQMAADVVSRAAVVTGASTTALLRVVSLDAPIDLDGFETFHQEMAALATYVDQLTITGET
jgi:hypothetical protein